MKIAVALVMLLLAACSNAHELTYVSPNAPMWEIKAPPATPAAGQVAQAKP